MQDNAGKQLRAYLSVVIGSGIYQDARFVFEAKPALTNTGFTPAYKVRYWAKAEVFDFPLPEGFTLPAAEGAMIDSNTVLAPHHGFELNALVNRRFADAEANRIKLGDGKRLYVWGKITYEDVFGKPHYTNFFHGINWLVNTITGEHKIIGHYEKTHNDAD